MLLTSGVCVFPDGPAFPANRSAADLLTSHHLPALSIPAISSSVVTLHVLTGPWTTVSPQGQFGPTPNRLELSIWPTASHLVADGQV